MIYDIEHLLHVLLFLLFLNFFLHVLLYILFNDMLIQIFCPLFKLGYLFSFESSLYSLDIGLLSDIYSVNSFTTDFFNTVLFLSLF